MAHPRFRRARAHKFVRYTGGDLAAIDATAWAVLHATAFDITLEAQAGDTIEVGLAGLYNNGAGTVYLDVATIVSAAIAHFVGTNTTTHTNATETGVGAWTGIGGASTPIGGSVLYDLAESDISGGRVLLRPYGNRSGAKTLYAQAGAPLHFWAKNLGPPDPH